MREEIITKLLKLGACSERVEWLKQFDMPDEAWNSCERGNDMLWLVGRLSGRVGSAKRRKLVMVACQCARLALPYVAKGEERPLAAIVMAERYARKEKGVSLKMVRDSANVDAANAAGGAAYYAAYVAAANVDAAYVAANAAYYAVLKQCAEIVRQHYTCDEIIKEVSKWE